MEAFCDILYIFAILLGRRIFALFTCRLWTGVWKWIYAAVTMRLTKRFLFYFILVIVDWARFLSMKKDLKKVRFSCSSFLRKTWKNRSRLCLSTRFSVFHLDIIFMRKNRIDLIEPIWCLGSIFKIP